MNLQELQENLKPNLKKYLVEQGITPERLIQCLNPEHEDNNPSMGYIAKDHIYHCFTCGAVVDIFKAHSILEGAPSSGPGFFYDNFLKLASRFNLEYEEKLISRDQTLKILLSRVHEAAVQLMVSDMFWNPEHILERNWDQNVCRENFIGSINNYEKFIATLSKNVELTIDQLSGLGIDHKLFNKDCITYTILDRHRNPIGFQCRNINYKERSLPKCFTTPNQIKYDGISKEHPLLPLGTRVFGIHQASKKVYNKLDIFEGPGSWVECVQNGHLSCVSVLGTGFNESTITHLYELGFRNINLMFDSDDAGMKRMKACIKSVSPPLGCRVTITPLDEPDLDPEDYIKKHGIAKFKSLSPISLFEIKIQSILKEYIDIDIEQLCELIIPLIVNSESKISQTNMINKLAKECIKIDQSIELGNIEDSIRNEVDRRSTEQSDSIKGYIQKNLIKATSKYEIREILDDALKHIDEDFKKTTKNRLENSDSALKFTELIQEIESLDKNPGWITGLNNLDNILNIIPKKESNMIVFGDAHHGKSAILQEIMKSMAKLYDRNKNLSILYWPLDDAYDLSVLRMLESEAQVDKKVLMNLIPPNSDLDRKKIKEAKDLIFQLMTDQRLLIKDLSKINNLYLAERWIRTTQDTTGNDVILVVDALNDIPSTASDDYQKQAKTVEWLQTVSADLRCNVFCTAHTNKRKSDGQGSGEPHASNLKGNNHLEFAGKIIASVYNELHDRGPVKTKHAWVKNNRVMPAIKFNLVKVKSFLGSKGVCWFKMDENTIKISEATENEVKYDQKIGDNILYDHPQQGERDLLSLNESVFTTEGASDPIDIL